MTNKVLEKLTPEQEARLPYFREKWLAVGTNTDPIDREAAAKAIDAAYTDAGLEPPALKVYAPSPLRGAYEAAALEREKPVEQVTKDEARAALSAAVYGQHDASWLAYYEAMGEFLEENFMPGLRQAGQECGWWYPYDKGVVICDRPSVFLHDEDGELHCEDGPAMAFRDDDFKVYAVHGVIVPDHVIEKPETITVEEIRNEENAEVRRIMRERYGDARYLTDIKAKVLDVDSVPVDALAKGGGSITRALFEDDRGARYLVGSDGSTERVYTMRVPEETKTCEEAYRALSGRPGTRVICEA